MKKAMLVVVLVLLLSAYAGVASAAAFAQVEEVPTLSEAVFWLLHGGGAGIATYLAIDRIPFLKKLGADHKRYASYVLIILLAGAAWGFGMLMGYMSVPAHWREWIEVGFSTMFTALVTSLTIHAGRDLRKKRLAGQ